MVDPLDSIHPNLKQFSHSSLSGKLHACPRLYEIYKLSPQDQTEEERNVDTTFGHAVGSGVQNYFATGSRNSAILATYLSWDIDFDEAEYLNYKKTLWHA